MSEVLPTTETAQPAAVARTEARPLAVVSVATLAWVAVTALFVLLRVGPLWRMPVGGAELLHLAGAWQAHIGVDDGRFTPTLFQALASLMFQGTASEVPVRVVALLGLLSIPAALWLLRPHLGEAGALIALLLLALDAPALALSVSGSALAFDLPLTLWLFVFLVRGWPFQWAPGVAGLLVALAGPLPLALLAGWAMAALLRSSPLRVPELAWAAGGFAAGVVITSLRFGLGVDGLVVAPLDLFAAGFDEPWSTATAWQLFLLYSWPLVLGGLAAAGYRLYQLLRGGSARPLDPATPILLGWTGVSLAWFAAGAASHQSVPLVALTTPLALLLGSVLPGAITAMLRADWRYARYQLPFAALASLLAIAIMLDWGRLGRTGPGGEQMLATLWILLAFAALAMVAWNRGARPALLSAAFVVGAMFMLPGVLNVAVSNRLEPLPSPISPRQARDLRDLALANREETGGLIVVHPDFEADITWPFRDSGDIVIASRVPPDATFVIWPQGQPAPEGLAPVEGNWALIRAVESPTGRFLDYLGWMTDRDNIRITPEPVAVYSRSGS